MAVHSNCDTLVHCSATQKQNKTIHSFVLSAYLHSRLVSDVDRGARRRSGAWFLALGVRGTRSPLDQEHVLAEVNKVELRLRRETKVLEELVQLARACIDAERGERLPEIAAADGARSPLVNVQERLLELFDLLARKLALQTKEGRGGAGDAAERGVVSARR